MNTVVNKQFGTSDNSIVSFESVIRDVFFEWKEESLQHTLYAQPGFIPSRSCLSNLSIFLDQGHSIDVVYFGFQ